MFEMRKSYHTFKQRYRDDLNNYRPISVVANFFKNRLWSIMKKKYHVRNVGLKHK